YIFRMTSSILNKFTLTCDRLSHFESKFCNPAEPRPSQYTYKVHLGQVRAFWDKVEKEYEACSELISVGSEGPADTLPTLQAKYNYSYFIYERCSAQLMEQIKTISTKAAPVQFILPQNSVPSGCRLPPSNTEVFSGDYLRWPTFRDLFTAVYIVNPALTPVEKLFFLNAKTSGEANSIVSNSPLTNDGNSFEVAKRRFLSLERRLSRDSCMKAMYLEFMEEYLALCHMSLADNKIPSTPHYVIPHQCVLRSQRTSTKLRGVFDASCKTSSQVALNDILMVGPTIQEELYSTLLR
ncbi:hypothetical protein KR054_002710, partial [Drosophila jambulina]